MYHVEDDPRERDNRVDDPATASVRDGLLAELNDGWNPGALAAAARQQFRDYRTLVAWGRAVRPSSDDAFVNPPGDLEEAIELRSLESAR
jgi:hypothetical protein